MSVAGEIARLSDARALLISKMESAGYEVDVSMNLNGLIGEIILKNLDEGNILPDTDTWRMYNGKQPDVWGGYRFEATFDDVWGGFYCYFGNDLIETVRGRTVTVSVKRLVGAKSKIELVVGSNLVGTIWPTETAKSFSYTFPEDMASAYLRAVVYGADDLHCAFEGISMKLA